jgi:hypothetical protein
MTLPSLPDTLFKLLTWLGLGLMVYSFISFKEEYKLYQQRVIDYNVEQKRLNFEIELLDETLEEIDKEVKAKAAKAGLESPLTVSDSGYTFMRTIAGERKAVKLTNQIDKLLIRYTSNNKALKKKSFDLSLKEYQLDELVKAFEDTCILSGAMVTAGALCFLLGVFLWPTGDPIKKLAEPILHPVTLSETVSGRCQSCGRKFNSMVRAGSFADGSTNPHFCSECYHKGEFLVPDLTLEQLSVKAAQTMQSLGHDEKQIESVKAMLAGLDRWNSDKYL